MKKKYNSFLIFESPIEVGEDKVYGALYHSIPGYSLKQIIQDFVEYVAGTKKWVENGNAVSNNKIRDWIFDGKRYNGGSEFVKAYSRKAYMEHPIAYQCVEGIDLAYDKEDVSCSYIVGEKLWKKFKAILMATPIVK